MTTSVPRLVAVMLNWKDTVRTVGATRDLLALDSVSSVVVVDNESDGSLRRALSAEQQVTVIEQVENLGFASGMNIGIRHAMAEAELVLCINNDATIDRCSLHSLIAQTTIGRAAMVAPMMVGPAGDVQSEGGAFRWLTGSVIERGNCAAQINFLTWACVLIPSKTFRDYGLLDERFFMYWEDVEFGIRLRSRGARIELCREARSVHAISSSHARAGAAIRSYSAFGLVLLARIVGGRLWVGCVVRLSARVLAAVVALDRERLHAVLRGALLGFRQRGDTPGFIATREVRSGR